MTNILEPRTEMAILPLGTLTFAEIIDRLRSDLCLSDARRRDLISGLRRVANALGRQPEQMMADPKWLQPRLSRIAPMALGLTDKSWQNAVSDARAALAQFGIVNARRRHLDDLLPPWRDFWQAVLASGDRTLTAGLGRFMHFLSNLGVAPDAVRQDHADIFLVAVTGEEITKRPEVCWRNALCAWNLAIKRIDGWPQTPLKIPERKNVIRLKDEALPSAFLEDLTDSMRRAEQTDPFAANGAMRALAASTIKHQTAMLKRFASELLEVGVPTEEVSSVAAVCAPTLAKRGLQAMFVRNGRRKSVVVDDMVSILMSWARRSGLDDKARAGLVDLAQRLAMPAQQGLTSKNRERLRALRDEETLRRLLDLPNRLCAKGREKFPKAAALAQEDALAIAILFVCPLRIGNISRIHMDQNLQRPGDSRLFLSFGGHEVKNGQPMEFEVPSEVRQRLEKHLANRSPWLCPVGTRWLFPRRDGTGPVDSATLSTRLSERILKETGIAMNPHLFRHLAAMLWLDANPGCYEAARRLLGHSTVSKTINFYAGLETHKVFEEFGKLLTSKKAGRP